MMGGAQLLQTCQVICKVTGQKVCVLCWNTRFVADIPVDAYVVGSNKFYKAEKLI